MAESTAAYEPQDENAQHPLIGALKGLLWIDPALDLTKPVPDPDEWERILDEKYGKDERVQLPARHVKSRGLEPLR